jgi:hypothetical protein
MQHCLCSSALYSLPQQQEELPCLLPHNQRKDQQVRKEAQGILNEMAMLDDTELTTKERYANQNVSQSVNDRIQTRCSQSIRYLKTRFENGNQEQRINVLLTAFCHDNIMCCYQEWIRIQGSVLLRQLSESLACRYTYPGRFFSYATNMLWMQSCAISLYHFNAGTG